MEVKSRERVRPLRSLTRAASGGVIVMVVLLVGLFMRGPGSGSDGEGSDGGFGTRRRSELTAAAETDELVLAAQANDGGLTDNDQALLAGNILNVMIDEHVYLVQASGSELGSWYPVKLDRLIEVARQAPGDTNGIRVRIQKKLTARASAEHRILSALEQAGIGRDAVFESSDLID